MKQSQKEFRAAWQYEFESWEPEFSAKAVALVFQDDRSEPYTRRAAHVFRLDNGKYALVTEDGCSCYTRHDAVITVTKSKQDAMAAYDRWKS